MRILVVSFYYHPDLSAGSFRTTAFVKALSCQLPEGSSIDVVTTLPNRYQTFSANAAEHEKQDGNNIYRILLPAHKSGMLDQSKSFLVFFRRALDYTKDREYDAVMATSSRLMTAVLAAWISKTKKIPLYLDIRDIFVDTMDDVFPWYIAKSLRPVFGFLERWSINKAARVNLVSAGFSEYFTERYAGKRFSFFTNGIDAEFVEASPTRAEQSSDKTSHLTALYAGNIGEGQGLHEILPALAARMSGKVKFKIIGDGGRKAALQMALSREGVSNVEILAPIERQQLIREYQAADILFLHLNDYDAFKKVLPSKLFEYGAMGKPIWAGVAGYAAEFVHLELPNAAVFKPCDAHDAELSFESLQMGVMSRADFLEKYARDNIMEKMAADFLDKTGVKF